VTSSLPLQLIRMDTRMQELLTYILTIWSLYQIQTAIQNNAREDLLI